MILKKTILFAVVAGLVLSATPAMGAAVWTGLGDGWKWSDMLNWQDGSGGWGPTGTDQDPRTNVDLTLPNTATTTDTTVDIDLTAAGWASMNARRTNLGTSSILRIPTNGYLDGDCVRNPVGSVIYVTGGKFGSDIRPPQDGPLHPGNLAGLVEISAGSWDTSRYTYIQSVTVHIVGSAPTSVYTGDFMSWDALSTPTLQFTLDAGGVTPFRFGAHGMGQHPRDYPGPVTIDVFGIAAYLAGPGNNVGDMVNLLYDTNSNLEFPAEWPDGLIVDGGAGKLHVTANGVDVEILPEPVTMALLAFGGLGLLLRRRRR